MTFERTTKKMFQRLNIAHEEWWTTIGDSAAWRALCEKKLQEKYNDFNFESDRRVMPMERADFFRHPSDRSYNQAGFVWPPPEYAERDIYNGAQFFESRRRKKKRNVNANANQ